MEPDTIRLKDIKPGLMGYIRDALSILNSAGVPDETVIHDIRVLLKKARSIIRLTKLYTDADFSERNLVDLKEAAGIMSSWRDTSVQRKILRELRKERPVLFEQLAGNKKIESILRKHENHEKSDENVSSGVVQVRNLLRRTSMRLRFVNMTNIDPQDLLKELEKTYVRASEKFLKCRINYKPKSIHEFRKKSKDLLYQLSFFRPLNSKEVRNLEKKLDELAKNLGKYNDLSQLIAALEYTYPESSGDMALNELIVRIRAMQDHYIALVWPTAGKIFCPGRKLANILGFKMVVFSGDEVKVRANSDSATAIYTYSK